jgi:hypothetical protein
VEVSTGTAPAKAKKALESYLSVESPLGPFFLIVC